MRPATPDTNAGSPSAGRELRPYTTSAVAWAPRRDLDTAEWAAAGRRLGAVGRCVQWFLGDWIAYGNARFGERYARASRITGYDPQTLMNMVYVASRFPASRRRENLSWSHHETLAALDREEQDHWLDRAEGCRWSVSDLRTALRSERRSGAAPTASGRVSARLGSASEPGETPTLICPKCQQQVPLTPNALATIRADYET